MAIESGPFRGTKLTGEDAERFLQHLEEDKPNPAAQASLERGREVLARMKQGKTFRTRERDQE